jgi:hypothetical protein
MNPDLIKNAVEFFLRHERRWEWHGKVPVAQGPLREGFYKMNLYLKDEKYWPDEDETETWEQGLIEYFQNEPRREM